MASSSVILANLRAGRCSNTAEVRLLRFWEARNVRKGGELMSVDMLLIDEESTVIHGIINSNRVGSFCNRLNEGSVYTLSGFDVCRSNLNFRLSDCPVAIRFTDGTSFERKDNSDKDIPTEFFRFRSHAELLDLANTNKHLPDIAGELSAIRSTITDGLQGSQRVMVTLRMEGGVNVCVSLFDNRAVSFQNKFDKHVCEPKIIIFTSINPKVVGGKLFLNATSGTHFYFDSETLVGKEHYEKLIGDGSETSASSSKVVPSQKIEPLSVAELNHYVLTADPAIIEFLCKAEVTNIQTDKGWCYIGCSKCAKKLQREETSFTCLFCDRQNATGVLRYRVEFSVKDNSDVAVFVAFDTEMSKLTHIQAAEVAQVFGTGVNAKVDTELPPFLSEMVGRTFTFQLKLGEFNFTPNHQTFTVSRIITEHERPPLPAFVDEGIGNGSVAIGVVGPLSDATDPDVKKKARLE